VGSTAAIPLCRIEGKLSAKPIIPQYNRYDENVPPDFSSVWAKLRRADEHFKCVEREVHEWMQNHIRTFSIRRNEEFTQTAFVAQMPGLEPDYERWASIIGDCVVNLRTSLDHLVYAVAKDETRNDPTAKIDNVSFLICDREADFDCWSRGRLKYIPDKVRLAIKEVQPFARKHPEVPPLLSILRDLANADKHHLLQPAFSAVYGWDFQLAGPETIRREIIVNPDEIKHDSIVCLIRSSEPDPDLKVIKGGKFQIILALRHGRTEGNDLPMADRSDFTALLVELFKEVQFAIEAVFRALG
jgi:hypothetical protein